MAGDSSTKPKLIAVDDEPHNLDYIARCLPTWEVMGVTNPQEAIEAAVRSPPAVMIVDYRMPTMNGVELARALRDAGVTCPMFMLTAYPELEGVVFDEQSTLLFQILAKPITPSFLRREVERYRPDSGG